MGEQIQIIRDLINTSIMRSLFSKNLALWNQLCSCLDVIGDSKLAIDAYLNRGFGESVGGHYLAVYGLLQALYIQQDAIRYLCESLGMPNPLDNNPRLVEIRNIRNDTIGHPTKRNRKEGQPTSCHFISQPTLKPDGFQLMSLFSNRTSKFADISILDLITDQKTCLSEILTSVIDELKHKERAHKEKFRMEKLVSVFPGTLSYAFGKVFDRIIEGKYPSPLALVNFQQIKQTLQNFREAIVKRGITYDSINSVYGLLEYPLAELEVFFQNAQKGKELNINEKTAFIFAFFVKKQVDELISMAKEIDEDYSS